MNKILITGSNSGMGFAAAKQFIQQGYAVIGTVRNQANSQKELDVLDLAAPGKLTVYETNLASLASVQNCSEAIIKHHEQIDIFIFNAGIMTPPYAKTENGFESQFQVNYLGHFYLFSLLKESYSNSLQKVISISSLSSEKGTNSTLADFERQVYCSESDYDAMKCYRESKLAQVLFTAELNNRFSDGGLKAYAIHPGVVNTNLFYRQYSALIRALIQPFAWLGYATGFLRTALKGAETAIYLATNTVEADGIYWADKKVRQHNPIADDQAFLKAFWEWSEACIKRSIKRGT